MDPIRQGKIRNVGAEMIDHHREHRQRAQTIELRLIMIQRSMLA
jgi:hypothetical protein